MLKKSPERDDLYTIILQLQTLGEAERFFRDLLTEAEIKEFATRWKAAQLLDGGLSYPQIQAETGLSTTTVARISKWLKQGTGGYRLALNRTHHHTTPPLRKGLS
ncbi:MAG: YerC/YecD family TrpR-related protein [bacterium]|nr:YerC/YecD family TrpR-related protein [bacterium]